MNKKRYKLLGYLSFLLVFLYGVDTTAAEYISGTAGRSSVGITFTEGTEQELSTTENTTHLPKTGAHKQNGYLFLGAFCLLLAIKRKKGELK